MITFAFEAIGTQWSIDVYDSLSEARRELLLDEIKQRIEVYDKTYSRFRKDSLITEMAHKADAYTLPNDAKPLLQLYKELYQITDGAVLVRCYLMQGTTLHIHLRPVPCITQTNGNMFSRMIPHSLR